MRPEYAKCICKQSTLGDGFFLIDVGGLLDRFQALSCVKKKCQLL